MARPAGSWRIDARSLLFGIGGSLMLLTPHDASAQDESQQKPVLDLVREGYEPPDHRIGAVVISTTTNVRMEYDSNVFAQPDNRAQDVLFTVRPALRAELSNERLSWITDAAGSLYRYARNDSENHEGYALGSRVTLSGESLTLGGRLGFERTFESRNDPEARQLFSTGPRMFTVGLGELSAGIEGNRTGLLVRLTAERYNFLSTLDNERDFTSYQGLLRGKYRLSARMNLFAQAYLNRRNFRLATDRSGTNRDGTSKAALIGLDFDPRGKLRGEVAAGVLWYSPHDRALKDYTGWELRGALVWQPRTRTAITLDAFRGDVATVRLGATGRIDSRVRLGVQQEARHNLLMSAGAAWRKTRFRGIAGQSKTTWSADGEIEYLFSRHTSVALTAQYVRRRSDDAFTRFRAGLELRFKL